MDEDEGRRNYRIAIASFFGSRAGHVAVGSTSTVIHSRQVKRMPLAALQEARSTAQSQRVTNPQAAPTVLPITGTPTRDANPNPIRAMGAASPDSGDLIVVEPARPGSPVAVVTINRPAALNALTKSMITSLAAAFRRLGADDAVAAVVLAGRGRAFCSGVDLTAAEEVFKGDVKDVATDPVAQMELCRKPIVGAVAGFAVTAGFEIALACDILVAGRSAKFIDTHAKFGIFPSWGLSQKLSRIIGPNRAREVSLTCMPVTAEMAERWGLVNHVVDDNEVLSKAIEVAEAIARNNRNLVVLYKSVINDGFKLDLEHAQALEKERGHKYYSGMTTEQFANMQKFIQGRNPKTKSKL